MLEGLKLFEKESALVITAKTQNTGEKQNLFSINCEESAIEVHHVATFIGNYLDIDSWDASNFIV